VKQVVGRVVGVEVWGGVGCIGCTECMGWVHRASGVCTHHPAPTTARHHLGTTATPARHPRRPAFRASPLARGVRGRCVSYQPTPR